MSSMPPNLLVHLNFVLKFTYDNMFYVELDPFGYSEKDLAMGNIVLRSNSTGDLYPFKLTHVASPLSSTSSAFSTNIWHFLLVIREMQFWIPCILLVQLNVIKIRLLFVSLVL